MARQIGVVLILLVVCAAGRELQQSLHPSKHPEKPVPSKSEPKAESKSAAELIEPRFAQAKADEPIHPHITEHAIRRLHEENAQVHELHELAKRFAAEGHSHADSMERAVQHFRRQHHLPEDHPEQAREQAKKRLEDYEARVHTYTVEGHPHAQAQEMANRDWAAEASKQMHLEKQGMSRFQAIALASSYMEQLVARGIRWEAQGLDKHKARQKAEEEIMQLEIDREHAGHHPIAHGGAGHPHHAVHHPHHAHGGNLQHEIHELKLRLDHHIKQSGHHHGHHGGAPLYTVPQHIPKPADAHTMHVGFEHEMKENAKKYESIDTEAAPTTNLDILKQAAKVGKQAQDQHEDFAEEQHKRCSDPLCPGHGGTHPHTRV